MECVVSEYCKEGNEVVSKVGCGVVLKCLLGEEVDVEGLLMGLEEGVVVGIEMVVRVELVRFKRRGEFNKGRGEVVVDGGSGDGWDMVCGDGG